MMLLIPILLCIPIQSMDIDESIFKTSMSNMFEDTELVNLSMSNFKEHPGLSSYDYCTLEELERGV